MLAHILGFFAVASFLWCFQLKTRRNIILVNITSRLLYILQYLLLGAFEGAVLDFMGLLLSFFAQKKESKFITDHFRVIMSVILLCLVLMGVYLYKDLFSIFAILGVSFEVLALWLTKEKNIRLLSLAAAPCWLMYNFASGAYSSVVGNVLVIVSIGIAMVRLDFKKPNKELAE